MKDAEARAIRNFEVCGYGMTKQQTVANKGEELQRQPRMLTINKLVSDECVHGEGWHKLTLEEQKNRLKAQHGNKVKKLRKLFNKNGSLVVQQKKSLGTSSYGGSDDNRDEVLRNNYPGMVGRADIGGNGGDSFIDESLVMEKNASNNQMNSNR